jgi:hypothetical protein
MNESAQVSGVKALSLTIGFVVTEWTRKRSVPSKNALRLKTLNPFWRDLGPALDVLQHKHGSQLAVRVQKEKMLSSNFHSGRNHRLSAQIGGLESD